jgi:hypothetical protein
VDRFACAGWLSHRPERLDGRLCRAPPCRVEGWHRDHRGDGQFPSEPANEEIPTNALVETSSRSPAPSSLRGLQWYVWFRLRTEIPPSQRYTTASGDCRLTRLTPKHATVPASSRPRRAPGISGSAPPRPAMAGWPAATGSALSAEWTWQIVTNQRAWLEEARFRCFAAASLSSSSAI